jgi:DNA-directed RNA polymerase specialized sigma subunit
MSSYAARVVREGDWWIVTVPDIGVTQARHLADVGSQVAGLIEAMIGEQGASIEVDVELPEDLREQIDDARRLSESAAQAQLEAASRTREVVRNLLSKGLPQSDIATVLGVSRQRVSQLARGGSGSRRVTARVEG